MIPLLKDQAIIRSRNVDDAQFQKKKKKHEVKMKRVTLHNLKILCQTKDIDSGQMTGKVM